MSDKKAETWIIAVEVNRLQWGQAKTWPKE